MSSLRGLGLCACVCLRVLGVCALSFNVWVLGCVSTSVLLVYGVMSCVMFSSRCVLSMRVCVVNVVVCFVSFVGVFGEG